MKKITIGFALFAAVIGSFALWQHSRQTLSVSKQISDTRTLPAISTKGFSPTQLAVLKLLQQEYAKNPRGYNATVLKYTEGFRESWCADFISWTFNEAGSPYIHPDTKYWRIPGVQTLLAYYKQESSYHEIGDVYTPVFGDVAFYFGETPDGTSQEHVAMVLSVQGDTVTTIGGNETQNSIMQVRHDKLKAGVKGLAGFGASGI